MDPIKNILHPTDFSETSEKAFQYCERLAQATPAKITVLHVFEPPDFWGSGGRELALDDRAKQQLARIRPTNESVEVAHVAHAGLAGEVICWIAQQHDCDLIVMGTHGRTGLAHLVLGSVAEYVLRHARCPVLAVRNRPADEPPLKEPEIRLPVPPII